MYDRSSNIETVNECQRNLFCQPNPHTADNLSPTKEALLQHTKRTIYQASCWMTCDTTHADIPTPDGWGWTKSINEQGYKPKWTTLETVAKGCRELVRCACKKGCNPTGRCSCKSLGCTDLCGCNCVLPPISDTNH